MSYAPIDEAWPQTETEDEYPATYAVYGGLRPELNRPVDNEGIVSGPVGFGRGSICPNSSLNESDTFSQKATPVSRQMHNTRKSRRTPPSIVLPESDYSIQQRRRSHSHSRLEHPNHFLHNESPMIPHECSCYQQMYLQPNGIFWWLDSRDAFIIIGGLVLLTLVGILIKRS
jgi:hypothetical protein